MSIDKLIRSAPEVYSDENLNDYSKWFAMVEKWAQENNYSDIEQNARCGLMHLTSKNFVLQYKSVIVGRLSALQTEDMVMTKNTKIFIVHGHDESLREQVKYFLKEQNLTPVILSEQASGGKTIIEKLEDEANDIGYAIILYTPDDNTNNPEQKRARQNVIFEHGYFTAKLGRSGVCVIMSDNVEKVGDNDGVLYIGRQDWKKGLLRELKNAGFEVDANKIL